MNLVCNMMPMSVASSYLRTFTRILTMIACLRLIDLNQHSETNVVTQQIKMVYLLTH